MAETIIIAGAGTGCGKTLITAAMLARMRANGVVVAAAKIGPDYIDTAYHAAASGRPAINVDPWAMGRAEIARRLAAQAEDAEMLVIEGVMGLFDGAADGSGATADLAATFGLPVVLILDASGQGPTLAAIASGLASHRSDVEVAGFILNRVSSPRQAEWLAAAVEAATSRPVVGRVPAHPDMRLPSRHLGLVQAVEQAGLETFLGRAGEEIASHISLCRLANLTRPLPKVSDSLGEDRRDGMPPLGQRIAVARDAAFGFAYTHVLDDWHAAGAEIVPFSPLANEAPDDAADAIFLPGGYPELHAGKLAAADRFLGGLRAAATRDALIYGECGGFMVLGETLEDAKGMRHAMAGLLPLRTSFAHRRLHLGYRRMRHIGPLPFPARLKGHEFHYATIISVGDSPPLFRDVTDATGAALDDAGLACGRVCGSFLHVIAAEAADAPLITPAGERRAAAIASAREAMRQAPDVCALSSAPAAQGDGRP